MKKALKRLGIWVLVLVALRIFSILLFPWYIVATDSMEPTIMVGNHVFASRYHYYLFDIQRGDIVFFPPNQTFEGGDWMHRVIAVEGDLVEIKDGIVTVNGSPTLFPEINQSESIRVIVPPGMVYQKGDSPRTLHGLEDVSSIMGKLVLKL